jgi:hypothetical protein
LCPTHTILDDDNAGRRAYAQARDAGLLVDGDINVTTCQGMAEAEFEDMLDESIINAVLASRYRIVNPVFQRGVKAKKWSNRMDWLFKANGKPWNERTCMELKAAVAVAVKNDPSAALSLHRRSAFDSLVGTLETRLG